MTHLIIDNKTISLDSDCYVVAEIGNNHQGSVETAMQMFRAAKECGADAVKLQKRDNRALYCKSLYNAPYVNKNSYGDTYGEHRQALEFDFDQYRTLKTYARDIDVCLFATAFDFPSVDFLEKLDLPAYKIASGDLNNTPLLKYIAKTGKPMLLSTGGGSLDDVRRAYDAIMPLNKNLCILQCTASYPVEPRDMNLQVISRFRDIFPDIVVGLSDHQSGIAMSLVAYTLGARIVEKHFTLNRAWPGTDHAFSLEPVGLRKLVRDLRRAREALGGGTKQKLPLEEKPLYKMGKKLVAARFLSAGHRLTVEDVAIKSPNDGLPPFHLPEVVGKKTTIDINEDDNIAFENLE